MHPFCAYSTSASSDETKLNELLQNEGIIRNKLKINSTVTNAKALRGKTVLVTEDVTAESGLVRLEGEIWTARTSGAPIPSGSYAQVETINGATAFVYPHVSTLPEGSAVTPEAE